nr:retrovirus-related Pol polyprotein from transposon TNT 1-94 [Tanacetum cinerariifolium]
KFEAKGNEGYFIRYSMSSKAFKAHDALLESSSSKHHVESSTQVPEGSGNLNPTASSSNHPADLIETLTVESPIPTVSSPVPTACLNDSLKPSSEARLISKKVANQEETPSLDNILSMSNRFEDILGVTTSSDEAIGVEADVKPKKISDALQDPSWVEAMQEELLQFKIQKVWTLVDCPKGIRPIGTKWVLKNKKDERGIV